MGVGSEVRDTEKTYSESRIQGQKGSWVRNTDLNRLHIYDCDKFHFPTTYLTNPNIFTLDVHNSKKYLRWIFTILNISRKISCYIPVFPNREDVLLLAGCDPLLDVGPAHRVRRGGQGHVRVPARRPHAHRCISPGRPRTSMICLRIQCCRVRLQPRRRINFIRYLDSCIFLLEYQYFFLH
jgi:hypothetical protein